MKFFNNKRIIHLKDGQFYKYLRYAFGEVILVVIGILIAIQLNTINNQKNIDNETQKILYQLADELESDIERLSNICEGFDDSKWIGMSEAISNCESVLFLLYHLNDSTLIDSIIQIPLDAGLPLINTKASTYLQLQSTGKLYNIKPNSLQKAIINYYSRAKREEKYNDGNNDLIQESLDNINHLELIKIDRIHSPDFSFKNYRWIFDKKSSEFQKLKVSISIIKKNQETNLYKFIDLKNQASDLRNLIINELEK
jgi:uncharacterized membrane protein YgaE (UPF0421/DUF939 family)